MEEKDREIRVGESRIYIGEDGIVYNIAVGASDKKRATDIKDGVLELANMALDRVDMKVQKDYIFLKGEPKDVDGHLYIFPVGEITLRMSSRLQPIVDKLYTSYSKAFPGSLIISAKLITSPPTSA